MTAGAATKSAPQAVARTKSVSQSYWSLVWWKFRKNKLAIIGAVVLILLYGGMAVIAEPVAPYGLEQRTNFVEARPQPIHFIDATGQFHVRPFVYGLDKKVDTKTRSRTWVENPANIYPIHFFTRGADYKLFGLIPSNIHLIGVDYSDPNASLFLLGADSQGRDYLSLIIYGGRLSLMIGLIGQFLTLLFGTVLGAISGYYGGTTDVIVQRLTEFLSAFPDIPLFMALAAAIPGWWSPIAVYFVLTVILAFVRWGGLARQVRGLTLSLREREYVLAAKSAGAEDARIMFRHLLPGTMSHVIVIATLSIPGMILAETALSWLGLGLRPPLISWGVLLQEASTVRAIQGTPWLLLVVPFILVTVLAYNMLGDGLRDAMDPYGARQEMIEMSDNELLVEIQDLRVEFDVRAGIVKAVDGVTFDIHRGQTLGVIGESGCGKSITARAILQMIPKPGKITHGQVLYHRQATGSTQTDIVNISKLDPDGTVIREIRGGEIGMIFQEPMSSLTPVYTAGSHIDEAVSLHHLTPFRKVGDQLAESIQAHQKVSKQESREIAIDVLRRVGIPKPVERVDSYPHQLSGGQRQRVMIAIAISCHPAMLIADEPTTALDVSIEAQILDIMREMQESANMAIMFITHNLGVIAEMAKEIVVMYMGKQVERASTVDLFYEPRHPYTRALLQSIPKVGKKTQQRLASIEGMVPDPFNLPTGCVFHPRCPSFMPGKCDKIAPTWKQYGGDHWASCLLYEEV